MRVAREAVPPVFSCESTHLPELDTTMRAFTNANATSLGWHAAVLSCVAWASVFSPARAEEAAPKQPPPVAFTQSLPNAPCLRLTSLVLSFAPGAPSLAHRHSGAVYVYVLEGAIKMALEGQQP